ncbi:adenylate/guanylate cyclase domain-containing protein [Williamsia maris]|nr:adenylate/guanylate cyclase domain-containing protein [Williamsia maris]
MRLLNRRDADYGSILLGSTKDTPRIQRIRIQILLTGSILLSNAIGAIIAVVLASVGIPEPSVFDEKFWWVNFIALPIYIGCALLIGAVVGTTIIVRQLRWSIQDRIPTPREARKARRIPWKLTAFQSIFWIGAVILFTISYGVLDPILIPKVFLVVGLSGTVVCAISYLLSEFSLRPVAAQIITADLQLRRKRSALRTRALISWMVGSGVPIAGMFLVVVFSLLREQTSKTDVFVGITVLVATALFTGLLLTVLNTSQVVAPVRSVRNGMKKVSAGETDVEVVIFDGTELGELQAGFNSMVTGLQERERLQDLFGRHVGKDVAEAALSRDPELGGMERTVAVVFVDVIGSTKLASDRPPSEVVTILNRFFAVIVQEVEARSGLVNKFEGDAVLAVFGAPIDLQDTAGAALSASREISRRLAEEIPELSAGIGVSHGPVVAGNVGAIQRFEYTVIGDAVNESARLSELAKRDPTRPLASQRAVDAAASESEHWERMESQTLRGRSEETTVFAAHTPVTEPA